MASLKQAIEERVISAQREIKTVPGGFWIRPKFLTNQVQNETRALKKKQAKNDEDNTSEIAKKLILHGIAAHNFESTDKVSENLSDDILAYIMDTPPLMAEIAEIISEFNNPGGLKKASEEDPNSPASMS